MYLSVPVGSLASCPDPDIKLEVLNFLLTSEVFQNIYLLIGGWRDFTYYLISQLDDTNFNTLLYRSATRMLSLDLLLVVKDGKQLGLGWRYLSSTNFWRAYYEMSTSVLPNVLFLFSSSVSMILPFPFGWSKFRITGSRSQRPGVLDF